MISSCESLTSIPLGSLASRPCRAFRRETFAGRAERFQTAKVMNQQSNESIVLKAIADGFIKADKDGTIWRIAYGEEAGKTGKRGETNPIKVGSNTGDGYRSEERRVGKERRF